MAYKPYRGTRARKRNRLLLVFTFILLLLIVGGVAFLVLQEHLVFTAQGFRFDFSSPGVTTTDPPASEPLPPLIIEQTTTQPPTEPPTEAAAPKRQGLTAAALVDGGAYEAATLPEGADRKAVYILDRDGVARIPTTVYGDEPTTAGQLALAEALKGSGGVAILSTFRNHEGAAKARVNAVTVPSGLTWLDAGNNRWFSPYRTAPNTSYPDAVTVAYHLFTTCADWDLGEVVLTNFHFPTEGQLALIDWNGYDNTAEARIAAISGQASEMRWRFARHMADDSPTLLSCLLTETAASAFVDELAGQSVVELAQYFDILYVPTADPDFDTGPLYEVMGGTGCRIGLWLKSQAAPDREIDFILVP